MEVLCRGGVVVKGKRGEEEQRSDGEGCLMMIAGESLFAIIAKMEEMGRRRSLGELTRTKGVKIDEDTHKLSEAGCCVELRRRNAGHWTAASWRGWIVYLPL